MLAPGTILVSRYRVLSQIGRGGMGEVFLVEHVHTGDRAALKVLHGNASTDPESIERFKREARAPARIQSENVVRVLDADTAPEIGGAPFFVMELLNGNDLQKIVTRSGRLPPDEVARVVSQVARALDKAHAIGIVHRDLKPENLFLHQREDGTTVVKILDFGISKGMESSSMTSAPAQLTRTGAVMGTPLYMSMEQALGRREMIGPQTDVWALGLIAIFLLTGQAYWQGSTVPDILGKVLGHALYAPSSRWPELPRSLDAWLLRSCARMPHERFPSAGEQAAALAEILRGVSSAAVAQAPTMLPQPTPPPFTPLVMSPAIVMTPPSYQPPSYTPPHVTPYPHVPGASTNEPFVHTHGSVQSAGMSTLAKVVIALVSALVLAASATAIILVFVFPHWLEPEKPSVTFAPPTATEAETAPVVPLGSIEPLAISATTTSTAAPKPHATTTTAPTSTATATSHTTMSREQCHRTCAASCVDANDGTACLVACLRKTCP